MFYISRTRGAIGKGNYVFYWINRRAMFKFGFGCIYIMLGERWGYKKID